MRSLTFEKPVFNFSAFVISIELMIDLTYKSFEFMFIQTNAQNDSSPQLLKKYAFK